MTKQYNLPKNQRRIGITGGIACGKSSIAKYIINKRDIDILDADIYTKELILPGQKSYQDIVDFFVNQIIDNSSAEKNERIFIGISVY